MERKIKGYGWNPDIPDGRDLMYAAPPEVATQLPPKVDLRGQCPDVYDQGQLGSCTANAIGAALEFDQMKEKETPFTPSRLFIYYCERAIEGTVNSDSGAQIRDGVKAVNNQGAPPETDWAYDITKFADKPPQQAFDDATQHKSILYQRVTQTLPQQKGCLAAGYPFVFGFVVYESFEGQEVASTGQAPMPQAGEKQLGGHAVLAVGYEDDQQRFIVRNSWGSNWGMQGYFTLPYPYLLQGTLSSDFWTIRSVQ
ncbi:MAG: peptidase [Actinobacteria bacterium]|nr:MAG: peptidase [Actinomycetota bacterium]